MSWLQRLIGRDGINGATDANPVPVGLPLLASQAGFNKDTDGNGHNGIISAEGRLNVGMDTPLFYESVDSGGATANPNTWTWSQLNMTHAVVDGFIVMNNTAITTINSYTILTSKKRFQTLTEFPLKHIQGFKTPNVPQANMTLEFGFGFVATTAAPTLSAAFLRYAPDGKVRAVARWTTSETSVELATIDVPAINTVHMLEAKLNRTNIEFYLDSKLVATVLSGGNAIPMVPTRMPTFWRVFTGPVAPVTPPQLFICLDYVAHGDANIIRPWNAYNASNGRALVQNSFSPFGQLAQWNNTAQPGTITPVNTGVGAYTTPGGLFNMAAVAAGATDLVLFSYQVPDGQQAMVSGVVISQVVTGAAVAAATAYEWGIAVNSSAASMATADLAGSTSAPKRVGLGVRTFVAAAAIGATCPDIHIIFPVEIACEPGNFIHIFFKPILGAATALLVFSGTATLIGIQE